MDQLFKSEKEAVEFIELNIPLVVKPTKPSKTTFVSPFSSRNAENIVVEALGKALYEFQEKSKIATNKDL